MYYCQVQKALAVLAVSSVGGAAAGAIYGKKLFNKKKREARFQQLSEMQTQGILDDDGDEEDENHNMVPQRVHGDISHN